MYLHDLHFQTKNKIVSIILYSVSYLVFRKIGILLVYVVYYYYSNLFIMKKFCFKTFRYLGIWKLLTSCKYSIFIFLFCICVFYSYSTNIHIRIRLLPYILSQRCFWQILVKGQIHKNCEIFLKTTFKFQD